MSRAKEIVFVDGDALRATVRTSILNYFYNQNPLSQASIDRLKEEFGLSYDKSKQKSESLSDRVGRFFVGSGSAGIKRAFNILQLCQQDMSGIELCQKLLAMSAGGSTLMFTMQEVVIDALDLRGAVDALDKCMDSISDAMSYFTQRSDLIYDCMESSKGDILGASTHGSLN